jgi:2-polyprenyl-3-methyl-5-hydroxy-6-metoxy-1,4-benzoquinol methylase
MKENALLERTITGLHENLIHKLPSMNHNVSILDIGCGTGAWLKRLDADGFVDLYGVDIDIAQVKTQKASIHQMNLDQDQTVFEQKFDLITAIEVIEHLENPGRLLKFVEQNLVPKGYFLLTTPNIHSLNCRLRFLLTGRLASFDQKGDQTHIYPVLLDALHRILPRYSLQVVNQWNYPEEGSLIYRASTQLIAGILGLFLPNTNSGDTLCLLLQRQ